MAQKALAEEHVGTPNAAIAAVGGIFAQCKKELPAEDFEKIMKVSGPQVRPTIPWDRTGVILCNIPCTFFSSH